MRVTLVFLLLFSSGAFAQKLKPLSYYLGHPNVSKAAKSFYKKLPLYQKNSTLYFSDPKIESIVTSIMDSVLTSNNQTRPFYLYLMNRNFELVDGSLMLTFLIREYKIIQTRPVVFFRYMIDNPAEKKIYFNKWAGSMLDFSDQYCDAILHRSIDSCLITWRTGVMALLSKENSSVIKLAHDFFDLMHIPVETPKTITIGADDNGKTIQLATGATIKARFRECRGCASVWQIAKIDREKIQLVSEDYSNPSCTNCVGGNHDHNFYLKVKGKGKSALTFTYFSDSVTINVVAN